MPLIDKFHEDKEIVVFLISTLAGGTGLNLTGANKVVIFGKSTRAPGRVTRYTHADHRSELEWVYFHERGSKYSLYRLRAFADPAHDLQAIDRAYRFGQTRDVSVFRLLAAGSIEELIYARQVYKQQQMQVGYSASFQTRYIHCLSIDCHVQSCWFLCQDILKEFKARKVNRVSYLGSRTSSL